MMLASYKICLTNGSMGFVAKAVGFQVTDMFGFGGQGMVFQGL